MQLNREQLLAAYRMMRTIREFEDRVHVEFSAGGIPGFVHLYAGEEASAVGICMNLDGRDKIASTHRGHGHCIAKGCDVEGMMGEIFGKAHGLCGGKGGSMHIADLDKGMMGANGIVGGGPPLICGAALTAKTLKTGGVAVGFVGDGGSNQGTTMEAYNLAKAWNLPAIFVVEDNGYAESTSSNWSVSGSQLGRAAGFGIPAVQVDGLDFFAMYDAGHEAVERARSGGGPTLIHAKLNRYYGHFEGDAMTYRAPGEVETLRRERDPIAFFRSRVTEAGLLSSTQLDDIDAEAKSQIDTSVAKAKGAAMPAISQLMTDVYVSDLIAGRETAMSKKSFRQAINEALAQEMRRDHRVVIMGEDIAGGQGAPGEQDAWGGPLGVTKGLMPEFGRERVLDTPITESGFIGAAVGAAATGLRPVAELMFVDFMGVCFDQIFNQAAKFRYMFGGKAVTPVVIRTMYGAGFRAASQHSQCLYPIFTHIPGLKVVIPSNAYEAKGLLIQAIRDDDPVMFFEHKMLYDDTDEVPDEPYTIPFGEANLTREGEDLTIVALGRMVKFANEAAHALAKQKISATVIDPRTTSPMDFDSIIESVEETGRLVVVDEAHPRCSMATDIAARVAQDAFKALKAPIRMVTPPHVPVPFSPALEDAYIPTTAKILEAARAVMD